MASRVCWYGHVLKMDEHGHVLRALEFMVEGLRKNGRQRVHGRSLEVDLSREDALC